MQTLEQVKAELLMQPPEGCDLKVGDKVTYTNDYGVSFHGLTVIGFAKEPCNGRFVHLDTDSYWFPVKPESLTKVSA